MRGATTDEAVALYVLADADVPLTIKQVKTALVDQESTVNINGVDNLVQSLVDKELLAKVAPSSYAIPDMLFKSYLRL